MDVTLARLEEKRIKSHKFRVGCVLFFSTSTVLDIDFCAFGVESFAFYVPENLCIESHVFPNDTELGTAIASVVFASL